MIADKTAGHEAFLSARDLLLTHREDYNRACREFTWPDMDAFNWALDWFDSLAVDPARSDQPALWIVEEDGGESKVTFSAMARQSNRVANWLRGCGVRRGDHVILMLGNQVELWESVLAAMKLGAVVIPASTLLAPADLVDRVERGNARHVIVRSEDTAKFAEVPGDYTRIAVGGAVPGWRHFGDASLSDDAFTADGTTAGSDSLLLYFTSGTTAKPKLVEHTHVSYPVGSLSTMYWIGLEPGDIHLNISSPGWAKHAWSNIFAPWNAGATVFLYNYARMDAVTLLDQMQRVGVTSFCAPPTVWRMLIQADLARLRNPPAKVLGAGEPLNPEVIDRVRDAWGVTIRDGFGQTETTAQIGNSPGQTVKSGSMGRPLPGYTVALIDPATGKVGGQGEICLDLTERPAGLMVGYRDDDALTAEAMRDGYYHTGDVASRDGDGYITYVGRSDDVFKSSDYRLSPFELESVLLEHEAVAEAAVVPSPDAVKLSVPKAYVALAAGCNANADTALSILQYARQHLAAYKRIRRIEFADLPKTISGKIRRVELRAREVELHLPGSAPPPGEYADTDFPSIQT